MSEASYVNIFSGHKMINNAKNGSFLRVFENPKFAVKECYQQADQCMHVGVFRLFVVFRIRIIVILLVVKQNVFSRTEAEF